MAIACAQADLQKPRKKVMNFVHGIGIANWLFFFFFFFFPEWRATTMAADQKT